MSSVLWNRTGTDIPGMPVASQPAMPTGADIGDGLPMASGAWGAGLGAQGMPIPKGPGFWKNLADNLKQLSGLPGTGPAVPSSALPNKLMTAGGALGGGLGFPGGQSSAQQQAPIVPAQFAPLQMPQSQAFQGQPGAAPNLVQLLQQYQAQRPFSGPQPQQAQPPQGLLMR
jgi:hypothetical protein